MFKPYIHCIFDAQEYVIDFVYFSDSFLQTKYDIGILLGYEGH